MRTVPVFVLTLSILGVAGQGAVDPAEDAEPAASAFAQDAPADDDDDQGGSDPWTLEAEAMADEAAADDENKDSGPVEFADSPWAAAAIAGVGSALVAILYAAAAIWGTQVLYTAQPMTPAAVLFIAFGAAPILPAAVAALGVFVLRPWWHAVAAGAAGLAAGYLGFVLGMGLLFGVGPLLPDPALFLLFVGYGPALVLTIAGATAVAGLLPLAIDVVDSIIDPKPARAPRAKETLPQLGAPGAALMGRALME